MRVANEIQVISLEKSRAPEVGQSSRADPIVEQRYSLEENDADFPAPTTTSTDLEKFDLRLEQLKTYDAIEEQEWGSDFNWKSERPSKSGFDIESKGFLGYLGLSDSRVRKFGSDDIKNHLDWRYLWNVNNDMKVVLDSATSSRGMLDRGDSDVADIAMDKIHRRDSQVQTFEL